VTKYVAIAELSGITGGWWAIEVPELPAVFSQARRLEQVSAMARDAVAAFLDVSPDSVEIEVRPRLVPDFEAQVTSAKRVRQGDGLMQPGSADLTRTTGASLADVGLTTGARNVPAIDVDQVRPALVAAYPELQDPLGKNDEDDIVSGLRYFDMATVAEYLGERLRAGETDSFASLFQAVERCLLEGSPEAVELVVVGLLEDLQNSNVTKVEDDSRWHRFLGPVTRRAWQAVDDFWQGDVGAISRFEVRPSGQ
jgi:predicted RNase H-like HicB family nuclease